MIYRNSDGTRMLTNEVRLSYAHLDKPYTTEEGKDPKYSVTLLIPKTDTETLQDMKRCWQGAYNNGVADKWGGKRPQITMSILHDGDGTRQDGSEYGPECKGHYVITCSSNKKPEVIAITPDGRKRVLEATEIYSGMYARVSINFYAYDTKNRKGIACGLGNVCKMRDGEPLGGGGRSAESDFESLGLVAGNTANSDFMNYESGGASMDVDPELPFV